MILVDTSVWVDHLRTSDADLARLLQTFQVATHPLIVGEIALGSLKNRRIIVDALNDLPQVTPATDGEVLGFIESSRLFGLGIGYIDAHLLAAVRLTPGSVLWTRDKRLAAAAGQAAVPVR